MGPFDRTFTAVLQCGRARGGWTFVVLPDPAAFFGTRGLVEVRATVDVMPLTSSFMALGDGRHTLPVAAPLRRAIGKGPATR